MRTVAEALAHQFRLRGISDTPRFDTELLLAHALGVGRAALYAHPQRSLSGQQWEQFRELLARRGCREPVAYLLGRAGFMDFELKVDQSVLIPRPETELLVELALETLAQERLKRPDTHSATAAAAVATERSSAHRTERRDIRHRIVDLGTGSGAIAIALSRQVPSCLVVGVDISSAALALAQHNAAELCANEPGFVRSDWCEGLAPGSCEMIVANPPYVAQDDPALHADCAWEPSIALLAGADGLEAIRGIVLQARERLSPGGWLLLEHGHDQREAVRLLLLSNGYRGIDCHRDHAGHDRLVRARRPA